MNIKNPFKTYGLIFLVIITAIAILDSFRISNNADELKQENIKLVEKVTNLESVLNNKSDALVNIEEVLVEVEGENKELIDHVFHLEKEIDLSKSYFDYSEFNDAINTIELFKKVEEFAEVKNFFLTGTSTGNFGLSFSALDREGTCPCRIGFSSGKSIEWIPNSILNLIQFSVQKDKLILIYETSEDIEENFQFVMAKGTAWDDLTEKWRIEEIKMLKAN
ncbi:hypothetical protein DS745_03905 [Anaerobacillus alkaliphilus]|uniref:Uncharacterized protein n=1 Tax=Anaerobacillus alkaliphilus TaxID=1548597 RepID=A0A4Q0VXS6_9BACI|nr:hypothetical protein [Anaerobacillus alkaliphilus]RXJ04537.1 hypothetical protein DS745_03905 [Anaerobacillus alkaliphilus]